MCVFSLEVNFAFPFESYLIAEVDKKESPVLLNCTTGKPEDECLYVHPIRSTEETET